jgi:hypothetical protein
MAAIRFKKPVYPIKEELHDYLARCNREINVPITYQDLLRFESSFSLSGTNGEDTLWETLVYSESDRSDIYQSLRTIYAQLKSGGDVSQLQHLIVDRVDYCLYANTHPFRVRIVNKINDLFDYFYVKQADASRIYGMELEHLLSPNKIQFLVKDNTLIEEHIQGIPGETFIRNYINEKKTEFNPLRLAKEFVKFNERSLVQLLGDMRRDNFIVEIIPDFDDIHFRLRAIDFDQECYEGNLKIYMPQFFKENNPIVQLGLQAMSPILELQYQKEERSRLALRYRSEFDRIEDLLSIMSTDSISKPENVFSLKEDLARLYEDEEFLECQSMGDLVRKSIHMLFKYPVRKRIQSSVVHA